MLKYANATRRQVTLKPFAKFPTRLITFPEYMLFKSVRVNIEPVLSNGVEEYDSFKNYEQCQLKKTLVRKLFLDNLCSR